MIAVIAVIADRRRRSAAPRTRVVPAMFIAHAPAGYLATHRFADRCAGRTGLGPALIAAGVMGSVLPDVDMLWFYLVDHRRHHHHSYFTHFPIFWIACALAAAVVLRGRTRALALAVTLNAVLHLVLDTLCGDVRWLAPFSERAYSLVTVPASHASWIASYLLHWTFLVELAIVVVAGVVLARRRYAGRRRSPSASSPSPRISTSALA